MCLGKRPPEAEAPAPAPPPPADKPTAPVLNEASAESKNASNAVAGARRGRSSLRINMNSPTSGGSGLTIPN